MEGGVVERFRGIKYSIFSSSAMPDVDTTPTFVDFHSSTPHVPNHFTCGSHSHPKTCYRNLFNIVYTALYRSVSQWGGGGERTLTSLSAEAGLGKPSWAEPSH